ncbi:hypothetical protein E2C01_065314 [Portunus trituberculatus]|uniref:Uncharacterized protein n=1 Tax=Portunus trituberculatus TaxID=210409 RepID=A0A5B7HM85_PORTR|nr:hypothetical protein [Portunus trituberculatus]
MLEAAALCPVFVVQRCPQKARRTAVGFFRVGASVYVPSHLRPHGGQCKRRGTCGLYIMGFFTHDAVLGVEE